jgi:hypothetical protein
MQNFANGKTPEFPDELIQELADPIMTLARRAKGRGMRIDFDFVADVLGARLARAVFKRAGFRRLSEQWATGEGDARVENFTFPDTFAEGLEDVMDDFFERKLSVSKSETAAEM